MKRKISLALSVGVLLTSVYPVQVLAKNDKVAMVSSSKIEQTDIEKYIPKIKSIFQIGDEYPNLRTYRYSREDTIQLSWDGDNGDINVSIDEEGNILSYYKWEYGENRIGKVHTFPKITREKGEKLAKEFIKKVNPDISDKIKISDDYYNIYSRNDLESYSYNFIRTEDNIPFNNDNINIYVSIDSQSGEVRSFHSYAQKNLKFPSKEGVISEEEAREIYKEKVGIELMYKLRGKEYNFEPYLGYVITNSDKTIEAKTKDIISTSQNYNYPIHRYMAYEKGIENVSIEEENKLINSRTIISRKDASKKIIDTFKLGEGYEVSTSSLEKIKEEDKYMWDVAVRKYSGNGSSGSSASIDAKTGEIISFYDPSSWDEDKEKAKYNKEELLKKAKEFIQKSNPEKYKEVDYIESDYTDPYEVQVHTFEFIGKSNDVKVENNGFRVGISTVTGDIVDYSYNWNDLKLPLPENIIDEDEAKEILLDGKELELKYQSLNQDEKDIKLVYDFKDKHIIVDASTGEIVDSQKELKDKYSKKEYKDIENSFVKNQINELQENIVLFEGENFKPKEDITQKDFLSLLIQTTSRYHAWDDEDYLYEVLTRDNIVNKEEKNPEGKVTREEAIKYIVRTFGQEQSGNLGNIYKINYTDAEQISDNLKGHVAIASGLGVISGEGNFRPKDNLRRDEAVVLIYNILDRK